MHFPLAFLSLAFGIDILHASIGYLPASITSSLPVGTDLTRAAYYLLSLGLLTAVPAVASGTQQMVKMVSKQGMYEQDGVTIKAKVKAGIAHAVTNDIVLAIAAFIWYSRRSAAANTIVGKLGVGSVGTSAATYEAQTWMVIVEALIGGLQFFSASIGGALTYNYGVGMNIAGGSKKVQ